MMYSHPRPHHPQPPTLRILETRLDDDPVIDADEDPENYQRLPLPPLPQQQEQQQQQNPYSFSAGEDPNYAIGSGVVTGMEPETISEEFMDADQYMMMLPSSAHYEQEVGIYGWRKKILYIFLIINVVLVGINFALAFWIISVLGFGSTGIGGIDLSPPDLPDRIQFKGSAIFQKLLFAKEVQSFPGKESLKFTTKNGNITFRSLWSSSDNDDDVEDRNLTETKIILTKDRLQIFTDHFEIYDRKKRLMFALDSWKLAQKQEEEQPEQLNQTKLSSSNNQFIKKSSISSSMDMDSNTTTSSIQQLTLRINAINLQNQHSLKLPLSIQTSLIENSISEELRIISPTGKLLLRGPKSLQLESKFGQTSMITFNDLLLKSNSGRIILDSKSISMQRLTMAIDDDKEDLNGNSTTIKLSSIDDYIPKPDIYQLCICSDSGKLFLSKSDSICSIDSYKDCR